MRVQILLSTFNGATYLQALIESLLAQDYPDVKILVRDDGSSDSTVSLLQAYEAAYTNIKVVYGVNLGFAQSFFKLLELASPMADYLALCDQDDVWQKDKVSRAVEFLGRCPARTPALYCSRLAVVDEDLDPLGYSDVPRKGLSFRNALVECPMAGCTILLNQAARQLLLCELPQQVYSHDWWIYLVISAFGLTFYDGETRILYRKHASNMFGISFGVINTWKLKIRRFLKTGKFQRVMKQAEEFRRIYGSSLSGEQQQTLDRFLKSSQQRMWHRLRYALSCDVYRQSDLDHLVLKMLIASNRL